MKIIKGLNSICQSRFLFSILCVLLLEFPVFGFLNIDFKNLFLSASATSTDTKDDDEHNDNSDNNNDDDNDDDNGTTTSSGGSHKKSQCNDGIDNDGDGAIDFPSDFSCANPQDNNEAHRKAKCQDGIDNDKDGLIDFPNDPGCTSNQDNSEKNNRGTTSSGGMTSSGGTTTSSGGMTSSSGTTTSSGSTTTSSGSTTSSSTSSAGPSCTFTICGASCCVNGCCSTNPFLCVGSTDCISSSSSGSNSSGSTSSGNLSGSTSSSGLGIDTASRLTIDVISTPKLPDIIQLPLVQDEFIGKIGFAYKGSNPSFEIRTSKVLTSGITSADIVDKSGARFANIPFAVFKIPGSQDTLILSLTLPDNLTIGEAEFILRLEDGESLTGIINVLNFIDVKTPSSIKSKQTIEKPVILRLKSHNKDSHKIKLSLRGNNFVGRKIVFEENGAVKFLIQPLHHPNTSVTVYPTGLNLELKRSNVLHNRKSMRIKLRSAEKITGIVPAVLVISTPRGIVSKEFVIRPKTKRH